MVDLNDGVPDEVGGSACVDGPQAVDELVAVKVSRIHVIVGVSLVGDEIGK